MKQAKELITEEIRREGREASARIPIPLVCLHVRAHQSRRLILEELPALAASVQKRKAFAISRLFYFRWPINLQRAL